MEPISPKPGWFGDLVVRGIDPDLVQSAFAPNFDEGILRYLQRMKLLSKSVRIITADRDSMAKGMRLLWGNEVDEAAIEAVGGATDETFDMFGMKVTCMNRHGEAILRLELQDGHLLELEYERLQWHTQDDKKNKPILEGVPHRLFPKSRLSCSELIDRYMPNSLESQQGLLTTGRIYLYCSVTERAPEDRCQISPSGCNHQRVAGRTEAAAAPDFSVV